MNWNEALLMASQGNAMRRASEPEENEGFRLQHSWDADDKPVKVFIGSRSKVAFVPESTDYRATDWEIEA